MIQEQSAWILPQHRRPGSVQPWSGGTFTPKWSLEPESDGLEVLRRLGVCLFFLAHG